MATMEWNDLSSQTLPSLSGTSGSAWGYPSSSSNGNVANASDRVSRPAGNATGSLFSSPKKPRWNDDHDDTMDFVEGERRHSPIESLEDCLARHQQEMFTKLLQETHEETRRVTNERIQAQLNAAWDREQEVWIQELVGQRSLGGSSEQNRLALQSPQYSTSQSLVAVDTTRGNAVGASPFNHAFTSLHATTQDTAPPDSRLVQLHLEVVRLLGKESSPPQAAAKLERSIEATTPALSGYVTALQLVQQLIPKTTSQHAPIQHAVATLVHLCHQFRTIIVHRVRKAALAGQHAITTSYRTDLATQASAFTQISLTMDDSSPWPILYYCLRCGDAVAALEVLDSAGLASETTNLLRRVLSTLASMQENSDNASCFWQSGGLPRVALADRQALAGQFDRALNDFAKGVYALLSGLNDLPTSETIIGFMNIEDYLTGLLWKALMQENADEELVSVANLIQEFGPAHFGDNESGGWSYAMPLMVTQQYSQALSHLANTGSSMGLLQASHLGLILSTCGVYDLEMPSRSTNADQRHSLDDVAAALMTAYGDTLVMDPATGALGALEYLARIPSKVRARKEVAALIAKTGEIEQLVGQIDREGIRVGGTLDMHFTATDISFLLDESAGILTRDRSNRQNVGSAAMCYLLAGRYANVLELLNQLISPARGLDDNLLFWIQQTKSFHDNYLDKPTHVGEVLEEQGKQGLIQTSRILLELNNFFHKIQEKRFNEAMTIVSKLGLVPDSQADLNTKGSDFHRLDRLVQQCYPEVLLGVMESLRFEHRQIQLDQQGGSSAVSRQRLLEIQGKARFIVTLAGLIGLVNDKVQDLSRLEALMI
jgi:hypothetical protein